MYVMHIAARSLYRAVFRRAQEIFVAMDIEISSRPSTSLKGTARKFPASDGPTGMLIPATARIKSPRSGIQAYGTPNSDLKREESSRRTDYRHPQIVKRTGGASVPMAF